MSVIVEFADIRDSTWWATGPTVQWIVDRHADLPVLGATGQILLWDENDDDAEEPTIEAGTIHITKPYLWAGKDPLEAMDDVSGDHAALACAILSEGSYDEAFGEWFEKTFGIMAGGDPIFVDDIDIRPEFRTPLDGIAAHAVIEAVAAFGGPDSPIIGYGHELVAEEIREECRKRGLWDWEKPLGAKPWHDVLVAARPQR